MLTQCAMAYDLLISNSHANIHTLTLSYIILHVGGFSIGYYLYLHGNEQIEYRLGFFRLDFSILISIN